MTLDGLGTRTSSKSTAESQDVEDTQNTLEDVEMNRETLDEESTLSASVQGVSQNLEDTTLEGDTQVEVRDVVFSFGMRC